MDDGDELFLSLLFGAIYFVIGLLLLTGLAMGFSIAVNPVDEGMWLIPAMIIFAIAGTLYALTRVGWHFVDRARERRRNHW